MTHTVVLPVMMMWLTACTASNGQDEAISSSNAVPPVPGLKRAATDFPWTDVRAFGANGDGKTDETDAIQAAIDEAGRGGHVYIPPGTYLVRTVEFHWSDQRITCDGTLQSIDGRSSPVALVGSRKKETRGRFNLLPRQINGNLRVKGCPDPGNTRPEQIPPITGILMQNVSWSTLAVEVEGCQDALRLYGDGGGVANNTIYIRRITGFTGYGVHLDANSDIYSWTNANRFFGGLIAGKSSRMGTGIYIAYSSGNGLNSNVFYGPMIEPAGQAIFCDGAYTVFHDVRYEAGQNAPNGVEFGPHSAYCRASFVYAGGSWHTEPVSNIRFEPATQTITGRFNRHDMWPGKIIRLRMKDNSEKHLTVAGVSDQGNGRGRIRFFEAARGGGPTPDNPIAKLETIGVRDAGRGNELVMGYHLGSLSWHQQGKSVASLGSLNLTGFNLENGASLAINSPGTAERDALTVLAATPDGASQVRYKITHHGVRHIWDGANRALKQHRIGINPSGEAGTQGDLVWNPNPEPGGYVGWICVQPGDAGKAVWTPFGRIAE